MEILLFGIVVVAVTVSLLYFFKDMFIVLCPNCKSINSSTLVFSSDSIKNQMNSQKGFRRARQIYYVTERYNCNKCGKEFERIARKQDQIGSL